MIPPYADNYLYPLQLDNIRLLVNKSSPRTNYLPLPGPVAATKRPPITGGPWCRSMLVLLLFLAVSQQTGLEAWGVAISSGDSNRIGSGAVG